VACRRAEPTFITRSYVDRRMRKQYDGETSLKSAGRCRGAVERYPKTDGKKADKFVIVNGLLCKEINSDTQIVVPKLMQTPPPDNSSNSRT